MPPQLDREPTPQPQIEMPKTPDSAAKTAITEVPKIVERAATPPRPIETPELPRPPGAGRGLPIWEGTLKPSTERGGHKVTLPRAAGDLQPPTHFKRYNAEEHKDTSASMRSGNFRPEPTPPPPARPRTERKSGSRPVVRQYQEQADQRM